MSTFAVEYSYNPKMASTQDKLRPQHREFLADLHKSGTLRLAGSWPAPEPGAILVLEVDSAQEALRLLESDPFFVSDVIAARRAHPYNVVFGEIS